MGSLQLQGSTSGSVTLTVPNVAGNNVIIAPATTGTMLVTSAGAVGYTLKSITTLTTSSGTYTTPSNVTALFVEVVGGGGGGGGVDGTGVASSAAVSGGGGGGGAIQALIASPDATYAYVVGAGGTAGAGLAGATGGTGGTSSFTGAIVTLSATGGGGGIGNVATTGSGITTGGAGGVGSITGSVLSSSILKGTAGGSGQTAAGNTTSAPNSGGCPLFGGGMVGATGVDGTTGTVFGEGGSSTRVGAVTTNYNGGAGFAGVIRVWEYY